MTRSAQRYSDLGLTPAQAKFEKVEVEKARNAYMLFYQRVGTSGSAPPSAASAAAASAATASSTVESKTVGTGSSGSGQSSSVPPAEMQRTVSATLRQFPPYLSPYMQQVGLLPLLLLSHWIAPWCRSGCVARPCSDPRVAFTVSALPP